jgi:rhodanese-related sulfurtransferase
MLKWLANLSTNMRLALLAFVLGLGALFASVSPTRTVSVHEKDLLTAVEGREDHVTPQELADWIITGRADYRLIDLRDGQAFAEYHIPTAERVSLTSLSDHPLLRNERIVLYSDGGIHAAQAWMLLKAKGYGGASTLFGGLDAWKDEVLFPSLAADATPEQKARFARAVEVARRFGGQPRTGGTVAAAVPALPRLEAPAPSAAGPAARPPKKRKEGC